MSGTTRTTSESSNDLDSLTIIDAEVQSMNQHESAIRKYIMTAMLQRVSELETRWSNELRRTTEQFIEILQKATLKPEDEVMKSKGNKGNDDDTERRKEKVQFVATTEDQIVDRKK